MKRFKFALTFTVLFSILSAFTGCSKNQKKAASIAVFIPGIMADSPTYAKLADGVRAGVNKFNEGKTEAEEASLSILEVGTNQAEWGQKLTALAAEGRYDVIISSNPSLPDLADQVIEQFPDQKFIFLDATRENNPNMMTRCYNQSQQGYVTGYIAGLMSKNHKVALISAQDYPVMNNIIFPSFKKGAEDALPGTSVDYRVVGNWYDATKGAEIADALYKNGVDVILPICGGASQGVISSARSNKIKITWFDSNGFEKAPDVIISSTQNRQEKLAEEVTLDWLEGKTSWGSAATVGMEDGYIEFIQDSPVYKENVPEEIQKKMSALVEKIKSGELIIK